MRITLHGKPGAGKSTLARSLVQKYNLKYLSTGEIMRGMAKERKITLQQIIEIAQNDKSIDMKIDMQQKEFGEQNDNFVVDGRLGFLFIPDSIKIFLDVTAREAAKRLMKRDHEIDEITAEEKMKLRYKTERENYLKFYGVDALDKKHYDLYLDTTNLNPVEVLLKICASIDTFKNNHNII